MAFVSIKDEAKKIVGIETTPVYYGKVEVPPVAFFVVPPEVISLSDEGHEIAVSWKPAEGATKAAVTSASLTLAAALVKRPVNATVSQEGAHRVLKFGASVTVTQLVFADLKIPAEGESGEIHLRQTSDLPADRRLVVSAADAAGNYYPMATAPASPQREMLPPPVGTAQFASSTLSFSGIKTDKIRLSLVSGGFPEDYEPKAFEVGSITAYADFGPSDCRVVDGADKALWSFPGELPATLPPAEIDLKIPLETALNDTMAKGEAPAASFRIQGGTDGKVQLWKGAFHGHLAHPVPGITTVELAGETSPLPCFVTLPAEAPTSAIGDLTLRYSGIRLSAGLNDPVPVRAASGTIVGAGDVVRPLPSAHLEGLPLARIGLIGRAPQKCELAVRLVRMTNGIPAETIGTETVMTVEPSPSFSLEWCTPKRVEIGSGTVGLAVRAVSGQFFWVKGNEDPSVKIALYDDNPSLQPVLLNGETLVQAGAEEIHLPGFSFPTAPFAGTSPLLESLLFLTVDLSDLELRYDR
ncbi:MAG: hypothetical protein A4E70_00334 [Syntrophus sp. PtaU1.Bin005]|jgi:hypothetical protein|nr:MAG: hypothetical protein A4E70_00334 [Syntrophus sp. PtaU1.Bin005]